MRHARDVASAYEHANELWDRASNASKTTASIWLKHRDLWQAAIDAFEVAADSAEDSGYLRYARSYQRQADQIRQLLERSRQLNKRMPELRAHLASRSEMQEVQLTDTLEEMGFETEAYKLRRAYQDGLLGRQRYQRVLIRLGIQRRGRY